MIAGLIFSTVYLLSVLGIIYSGAVLTPKQSADTPITNYSTIENNLNTINLLQEDIWDILSLQERLNVLQTIANIEASYLGLPHELNVISAVMDEETLGYYNDQIHTVAFNIDFLRQGNSADILETLTHEAFHAYEHRLVDLYEHATNELKDPRLLRNAKSTAKNSKITLMALMILSVISFRQWNLIVTLMQRPRYSDILMQFMCIRTIQHKDEGRYSVC